MRVAHSRAAARIGVGGGGVRDRYRASAWCRLCDRLGEPVRRRDSRPGRVEQAGPSAVTTTAPYTARFLDRGAGGVRVGVPLDPEGALRLSNCFSSCSVAGRAEPEVLENGCAG